MSTFLLTILSHTPLWVWGLLAMLVALGMRQARTQTLGRGRLVAVPIGLGMYSFLGLLQTFGGQTASLLPWLAGAALGFALNQLWQLPREVQALPDGRFRVGGSWVPLALYLAIFLGRYALNVTLNMAPHLAHALTLVVPASLLMGLSVGLLAARAVRVFGHAQSQLVAARA
jgi:hypothetical protein